MQNYDILMLAVLGVTTLLGFMKGFAWQLASITSLVLSYFVALRFADALAPQLNADPRWAKYLAMLILYCGTGLVVWLVFRFISGAIDQIKLREFDRQMGGLLGFGKGVLLCTVITFFAVSLHADSRAAVLKSKSGYYISDFLHKATPIMPPELTKLLGPYLEKLERGLDPTQELDHPTLPNLPAGMTAEQLQQLQQLPGQLPPAWLQQIPQINGGNAPAGYYPPPGYQQPGTYPGMQPYGGPQQPSPYAVPQQNGGQPGGYSSGFGS